MVYGTVQAYRVPVAGQAAGSHFGGSVAPILGHTIYIAIAAFSINVVVTVALTLLFRALRLPDGADETSPASYTADPEPAVAQQPQIRADAQVS